MPSAKWRQFCVLTLDILYSFRERQKWFWFCTSSRHWHHVGNHPGVDKNRSKQLYIVRIRFTDLIWRRIGAPAGQVLKELHGIFDNRNGNQLRSVSPWIVDMINNHSHRNVSPWSFLSNWFMLIKSIINKTGMFSRISVQNKAIYHQRHAFSYRSLRVKPAHMQFYLKKYRVDSRFVPSQWEMALLCNDVSHWLGANLESPLEIYRLNTLKSIFERVFNNSRVSQWLPKAMDTSHWQYGFCPWGNSTHTPPFWHVTFIMSHSSMSVK